MYNNTQASYNRKVAITKSIELADQIVEHLAKVASYPNDRAVPLWIYEINGWRIDVYNYLSDMKGGKYSHGLAMRVVYGHVFVDGTMSEKSRIRRLEHKAFIQSHKSGFNRVPPYGEVSKDRIKNCLAECFHELELMEKEGYLDVKNALTKYAEEAKAHKRNTPFVP